MQKIAVVGVGRVGESAAQLIAQRSLSRELVLVDRDEGKAAGAALDIQEAAPLQKFDVKVRGGADTALMEGAGLVVVTAGLPRRPGMSRGDLLDANLPIIEAVVEAVVKCAPQALLLMVTNPVDLLTYRAFQLTGWGRHRIVGQAGVLDGARLAAFVAMESGVAAEQVSTLVMGGHGDAMLPLLRHTSVGGVPVDRLLDARTLERLVERTRKAGAEVLALRRNSSAYRAPAAAIAHMAEALCGEGRRLVSSVSLLDGEYGQRDIAIGVPAVLSMKGVEEVVELELTPQERAEFERSVAEVRAGLSRLHSLERRRNHIAAL